YIPNHPIHNHFIRMQVVPCSILFPYTTLFRSPESSATPTRRQARSKDSSTTSMAPLARTSCTAGACGEASACATSRRALSTSVRSEEHTSELQSRENLVCRLLLEKKKFLKSIF